MSKGRRNPRDEDRASVVVWLAVALAWALPTAVLALGVAPPWLPILPVCAAAVFLFLGTLAERLAPARAALPWALALLAPALAEAFAIAKVPSRATQALVLLALPAIFALYRARAALHVAAVPLLLFGPPLASLLVFGAGGFHGLALALPAGAVLLGVLLRHERQRLLELASTLEGELVQRASLDSLTGVLQRSAFESRAPERMWLCALSDAPVSLLRLDLDRLKRLNEKLGYAAGDTLIQQLGELIRRQLRQGDLVARLGGGGFVALLPGASLDAALRVAERIRRECERLSEPSGCTLSAGVAQRHRDEPLAELLARADEALERAKRLGRNRVEVSSLEAHA
jgi:diguanylate cyclase (GGDEF)-like protein